MNWLPHRLARASTYFAFAQCIKSGCVVQHVEPAKADGAVINPLASWRTTSTMSDSQKDREAPIAGGDGADFVDLRRKRNVEPAHQVLDILSSLSGVGSNGGAKRETFRFSGLESKALGRCRMLG